MTPTALLLVIGAAVLHAGWNALVKRGADPLVFLWCTGVLASLMYLPFTILVLHTHGFRPAAVPFVIATILLHSVYFFTLGRAYRLGDYSLVYPVARGLGVALVPMLGLLFLDERLSPLGTLGIVLVVTGIFSLHWRPGAWSEKRWLAPGTGWALATGLSIAAYSLVDKAGVARLHPVAYIGLIELGSCVILTPLVLSRRHDLEREWARNRATIVAAAFGSPTGYLLVLFAFQFSKAAYVVAAREMSIVLSALIGSVWLGEGNLRRRLAGAAVVLAGVVCVALAR